MLILFETAAGYALFKVLKTKLESCEDVHEEFASLELAQKAVKLKAFSKFDNTTEALAAATALVDSKLSKPLKKFLKKNVGEEQLAVLDKKLGGLIQEKMGIACVYSNSVMELTRGIRSQLQGLVSYKLKFSPDKVDTMIVQAIGLLDDLDKELNTYAMRVREWYGWHFPEMTKITSDNIQFAKAVKLMGMRDAAASTDFSGILEEEVEARMKEAAIISMGTEISGEDLANIRDLCDQVIDLSEYRAQLYDYLKARMAAIAPNLTVLVGELVGARLIAHSGSLINLAKQPASTVQILGAEKALFRALKTKHDTPKYGLIYHASLIGQSSAKFKGKISRVLAAKCALAIRVDALGDGADASIGIEARAKVEARMRQLEGRQLANEGAKPRGKEQPAKYDKTKVSGTAVAAVPQAYNADADVAVPEKKKEKKRDAKEMNGEAAAPEEDGQIKKSKKVKKAAAEPEPEAAAPQEEPAKKKKKKDKEAAAPVAVAEPVKEKKSKKARKAKVAGSDSD